MNNLMPADTAYEFAARIGQFLINQGLKSWSYWEGKIPKTDQLEYFGVYLGRGTIVVDGRDETLYAKVKVCFGGDVDMVRGVNCKDRMWWDNQVDGPLEMYMKKLVKN